MSRRSVLTSGLEVLGIAVAEAAVEKLLDYVALLEKWNHTYNLTAIRDGDEMVKQHLLDSLAILPHLMGVRELLDIGSGAGLPGIPLAIADPELTVTLVESVQKKSAFQQQAKIALQLSNVSIYSGRIEDFRRGAQFDAATARAFSKLCDLLEAAAPLLRAGGRVYAMKGAIPHDEIDDLPAAWQVAETIALHVPGLDAERHLLILERS